MDHNMEKQINYLIADTLWSQISGKYTRGTVLSDRYSSDGDEAWKSELEKMDLKQNPEKAKEIAEYFIGMYQEMGEKILENPSFILDDQNPQENWEQLLSIESLKVRAIGDTIQQMAENEPSLKQDLQEYMENQIKDRIKEGNKALEIGYLFAKEPFSPEVRASKMNDFKIGEFQDSLLEPRVKKAIVELTGNSRLEGELEWKYNQESNSAVECLYIGEPEKPEYRLKEVVGEEVKRRELIEKERLRELRIKRNALEPDWFENVVKDDDSSEYGLCDTGYEKDYVEKYFDKEYLDKHEIVSEESIQTYFKDALNKLQDEEYEKDPKRFAERLIKMQLMEDDELISDPEDINIFEKEKNRLFHLAPNEKLMNTLVGMKAELYQKRGETEQTEKNTLESVDYKIQAFEELTKGSRAYELVEAGKDFSAYPLFEKGMQEYQSAQTERHQGNVKLISDAYTLTTQQLTPKERDDIADAVERKVSAFEEALGDLDRSEEEKQKKYMSNNPALHFKMLDGVKTYSEKYLEEQKKEQQEREQEQRLEEQFEHSVSEADLTENLSPLNVSLATKVNELTTSVKKGVFGGKKDNSREYDNMVQKLSDLFDSPIRKEPTLKQREDMNNAYEVCRNYAISHAGAKTAEGKRRLNLVKETMEILTEMNPDLQRKQASTGQNAKKISFRDLEHAEGRSRSSEDRREARRSPEANREKDAGRGRERR